jgi:phenylalanyl-tRNA synthetase alpha chain
MSTQDTIESVRDTFRTDSKQIENDPEKFESIKIKYLGRKGLVANLFSNIPKVATDLRPKYGKDLNELKNEISSFFNNNKAQYLDTKIDSTDNSLPGPKFKIGNEHPIQKTLDEIKNIFINLGFSIAYGPEIDDDFHNFSALNFPEEHPARDMQDTFFIEEDIVLRTHTSNVQVHLMEEKDPPLRYIVPGRVYRNESISFKSYCLFHQIEGLYVDKNVSFADHKAILEYFVKKMFGLNTKMRFRPSFFPFTEPSAEVDIWSEKRGQWLEILGSGMVDPEVFKSVNIDEKIWSGFAFGLGVERICMLKYEIDDIRLLYQGDIRFLEQF